MKIATWNVNSIRARLERLLAWLQTAQPDIVCLQELKVTDAAFPGDAIRAAGYHAAVHGQKTYNGVAILSRVEPAGVRRGMGDGADDPQARFLAAQISGIHVVSAYVPNGRVVGSEPYAYKLAWLRRLRAFLETHFAPAMPVVVCGDFNVARTERDVTNPAAWAETRICCYPGGTTGCWPSPRTTACGWTTSSPPRRWPAARRAERSTGRSERAKSPPITRR
jgi:exodeoxyribonuclease-3